MKVTEALLEIRGFITAMFWSNKRCNCRGVQHRCAQRRQGRGYCDSSVELSAQPHGECPQHYQTPAPTQVSVQTAGTSTNYVTRWRHEHPGMLHACLDVALIARYSWRSPVHVISERFLSYFVLAVWVALFYETLWESIDFPSHLSSRRTRLISDGYISLQEEICLIFLPPEMYLLFQFLGERTKSRASEFCRC